MRSDYRTERLEQLAPTIRKIAAHYATSSEDRRELSQEACIRVWEILLAESAPHPNAYYLTAANRRLLDLMRSRARRLRIEGTSIDERLPTDNLSPDRASYADVLAAPPDRDVLLDLYAQKAVDAVNARMGAEGLQVLEVAGRVAFGGDTLKAAAMQVFGRSWKSRHARARKRVESFLSEHLSAQT